jgi:hypothetical protein
MPGSKQYRKILVNPKVILGFEKQPVAFAAVYIPDFVETLEISETRFNQSLETMGQSFSGRT